MSTLNLSHTLVAGTAENVNDVQDNFDDIVAWSEDLDESNLSSSSGIFSHYRTISQASGSVMQSVGSGAYFFRSMVGTDDDGNNTTICKSAANNHSPVPAIYFDDADYAISGLTQRLRVRGQVYVNTAGPAVTFTFGLYPISSLAGTSDAVEITLGTVTSGSTAAIASPSASSLNQANSGDFSAPADGHYVLGVALSGTTAVNSGCLLSCQLQTRWT